MGGGRLIALILHCLLVLCCPPTFQPPHTKRSFGLEPSDRQETDYATVQMDQGWGSLQPRQQDLFEILVEVLVGGWKD